MELPKEFLKKTEEILKVIVQRTLMGITKTIYKRSAEKKVQSPKNFPYKIHQNLEIFADQN